MYNQVETVADMNIFNQIWMECWLEKGYMLDLSDDNVDRFIIQDLEKRNIGTVEFKPYFATPKNNINQVFPFHKIEHIAHNPEKAIEVDKVAILRQHRGKNLERLLSLCVYYSEFYQKEYCVVLLERLFYKALKNFYKVPLETMSDPIYYKGDHVIPVIIYVNHLYSYKERYSWLVNTKPKFKRVTLHQK
ncbi:MAG: hypothetical protein LRY73_07355 [Bacillus sp. (in: Bacteria)]|nr:hypothetical protein [Bacillus sp. (in: firmicutes)]